MNTAFFQLEQELNGGRPAVLLTLISQQGSAPRGVGSHQLLCADGSSVGTIGGGIAEYKACAAGRNVLATGRSCIMSYVLHPDAAADIGAVCGGEIQVFCQYIAPAPDTIAAVSAMVQAVQKRRRSRLIFLLTRPDRWGMAVAGDGIAVCGDPGAGAALAQYLQHASYRAWPVGLVDCGTMQLYCEQISRPGRVILFGGGHVAYALVPVLTNLDFSCVVVDDREAFANSRRFPDAEVVVADLEQLPPSLAITPDDYVCIMTRGHAGDYAVERQVLPMRPGYIGVIGSRNKLAFVRDRLLQDGFSAGDMAGIYAPIGLPISAATPEEIAVSIAAELIAVRARREGREKKDACRWGSADVPRVRLPE